MDKRTLRIIFTILTYAGILVCVAPHLTGKTEAASIFLLTGVLIAVISSILSCGCMDEKV
jgi:hypothetical protein